MMVSHINGYTPLKLPAGNLKINHVEIHLNQTFIVFQPLTRHGEAPSFAGCDSQYFRTQEEGAAHEEFTLLEA